jgi:hypothetical protein
MTSSRQLLAAEAKGAEILHNGAPVVHWPRGKGDREPYHVRDASGRCMRASSVRRCRLQWSDDPGVHALVAVALAALVTAVLVLHGLYTSKHEPEPKPAPSPTWVVEYGPTEIIAPYLPPEQRAGHTDRDGERVDFFGQ